MNAKIYNREGIFLRIRRHLCASVIFSSVHEAKKTREKMIKEYDYQRNQVEIVRILNDGTIKILSP